MTDVPVGAGNDREPTGAAERVVEAAWRVIEALNRNVPWSPLLLDLQHALVAYGREPKPCPVCGEAVPPDSFSVVHARCRSEWEAS